MTAFNLEEILGGLHPLEIRLLRSLNQEVKQEEIALAEAADLAAAQFRRAIEWLLTKDLVTIAEESVKEAVRVTDLGRGYLDKGVPEDHITALVMEKGGMPMAEFKKLDSLSPEESFPAIGVLKNKGLLVVEKGIAKIPNEVDRSLLGETSRILKKACEGAALFYSDLNPEQQNLVSAKVHKRFRAKGVFWLEEQRKRIFTLTENGKAVSEAIIKQGLKGEDLSRLTPKMLEDGSWKGKSFRKYNINLAPPRRLAARKHPYRSFLDYVKFKLISMGFEEMQGPLVESEFWNMDALFMPQFHAAREIQDAYFIKEPTHVKGLDKSLLANVKESHENGGKAGSRGWSYQFDEERTKRLVLRFQSTAISARTLASNPKIPGKYFAMARCFRYDTVDATHGCDFMQVEGIALGSEINFRTLLGLLKLFATEVAKADEVIFAPAYFPFTGVNIYRL